MIANEAKFLAKSSSYSHRVVYKFNTKALVKSFYECEESSELSTLRNEMLEGFMISMPKYKV